MYPGACEKKTPSAASIPSARPGPARSGGPFLWLFAAKVRCAGLSTGRHVCGVRGGIYRIGCLLARGSGKFSTVWEVAQR